MFVLLLACICLNAVAQDRISWNMLSEVQFDETPGEFGISVLRAQFGDAPSLFEGKDVILSGYMIPIDPSGKVFVLSKNPNSTCFFCGGAGPETIVELWPKKGELRKYKTDEWATFQGILRLNEDDPLHFNYILAEAQEVK